MRTCLLPLVLLAVPSLADDGFSSPIHKRRAGEMVCASSAIAFGAEDTSAFKTSFSASDPIWCRVYWHQSQPFYSVDVSIDGRPWKTGWASDSMDGESRSWTTFQVILNSQQGPAPHPRWERDWARLVNQLSPGTHAVTLSFRGSATGGAGKQGQQPVIATATLQISKDSSSRLAVGGSFPADAWATSKTAFGGAGYPKLRSALATRLGQGTRASDIVMDRLDDGFIVNRYADTGQTYRRVRYTVLWRDTNGDGICQIQSHIMQQDKLMGGRWGPWSWRAPCDGSCPQGEMDCPR